MKGLAYYEAVVQIIPVLVLVIVVEYRLIEHRRWEKAWQARLVVGATALVMLLVAWSELTALAVLKEEKEIPGTYHVTRATVFILIGVIIAAAESRRRPPRSSETTRPGRS